MKNSYCTGEEGRLAAEEAERFARGANLGKPEEADESTEVPKAIAWQEEAAQEEHVPNAVDRPEKTKKDSQANGAAKKRTLEEMRNGVTEEEMEEYRKKRTTANDPMANLLGKDELLD